jgi:tyrosyl-tRNA synthetase
MSLLLLLLLRLGDPSLRPSPSPVQVFQGADFLRLHQDPGLDCWAQLGGADQWGNITAGVDLVRRVAGQGVYGLTTPLLTAASGRKFGKSEGNALWLDPALTSHSALYQYLLNTAGEGRRGLRLFCGQSGPH